MKRLFTALFSAAAALAPGTAYATVWNFNVTGNGTASFLIDSSVTTPMFINNTGITYTNVAGIFNGVAATRAVQFFNSTSYGGFNIGFIGQSKGAVLYTGSPADPVFTTGTFDLLPLAYGAKGGFTMTIQEATAAVPEPASWVMMIVGFGMVGGAIRQRKTAARFA